jgi:hypothetical protein
VCQCVSLAIEDGIHPRPKGTGLSAAFSVKQRRCGSTGMIAVVWLGVVSC